MRMTSNGEERFYGNGSFCDSDGDGLEIRVRHYDVGIVGMGRLKGIAQLSHEDFIALADEISRLANELKTDMARAKKLAPIAEFYEAGHSLAETMVRFKVSSETVRKAVRENGGVMRSARPLHLTDEAVRAVYDRYLAGESLAVMAIETAIAYTTYRRGFERLGLTFPVKRGM
jgi:hypothetical protein